MSSQTLNTNDSAHNSASISSITENQEDSLPEIKFSKPTDAEEAQIKLALPKSGLIGNDLQAPSCDNGQPAYDGDIRSLYRYDPPPEPLSIPAGAGIISPNWEDSRMADGNDYASFGDDGTTATVNAHGSIIQITRSLGYGRSGLFCVDIDGSPKPTTPRSRLDHLMKLSKSSDQGLRLMLQDNLGEGTGFTQHKPRMEFVYNRWPRFTSQSDTLSTDLDSAKIPSQVEVQTLQYFCHKGTVFQKYTFNQDIEAFQQKDLHIQRRLRIRTLDFVNDSTFNDADTYSEEYIPGSGPHGCSFVWIHKMTKKVAKDLGINAKVYDHESGPKAVALIITAFVNGKTQVLDLGGQVLHLQLSKEVQSEIKHSKSAEITIAYRLQVLTSNPNWKQSLVPASALASMDDAFSAISPERFQNLRWSSHEHMNFITGRNLEHILSVCSIPMPKSLQAAKTTDGTKEENGANAEYVFFEQDEMDTASLAFTCGDMSGHRIASTANFFAFEFLIEILKYLSDPSKDAYDYLLDPKSCQCKGQSGLCKTCQDLDLYKRHLRIRIMKTLEAHLSWTKRALNATPHVPHYWMTGKVIRGCENHRYLSPPSLTDIPFEIIKFHSLYRFYKSNEDLQWSLEKRHKDHMPIFRDLDNQQALNESLRTCIQDWVKRLYKDDKRCYYAFSRGKKDGAHRYHLADHVWIFRAFKCIEALKLGGSLKLEGNVPYLEYLEPREKGKEDKASNTPSKEQCNRNWSTNLQRIILKRFTTRNPQSQQRMLATSRTVSETRFLFHAKDTALFYAMDDGFFDRIIKTHSGCINWTNKISVWKETVDAQAEHEETQNLEWEKPLWYALALVVSSRRKRINKISADKMLHTAADILFSLSSSSGLFPGFLTERREPIPFEDEIERDKYWHATFEIPYALWIYGNEHLEASLNMNQSPGSARLQEKINRLREGNHLHRPMRKKTEFTTFDSSIDKKRLVEFSDDWLRDAPSSLNFDSEISFSLELSDIRRVKNSSGVIRQVLFPDAESLDDKPTELRGKVFDVPKTTSSRRSILLRQDPLKPLESNKEIKRMLQKTRTAQNAKKRLIWLPQADKVTALTCYFAAAQMERDNLSAFFDRHASYEKHFSDDTSAALNEWTTEFHLSYFRKSNWDSSKGMIPELSLILVDPRIATLSRKTDDTKVVRSVMSFRFVGDFFDRYWTCHFVECDPVNQPKHKGADFLKNRLSKLGTNSVEDVKHPERKRQPWQQRKVLELLLFEYITRKIKSDTEELLEWVRKVVLEEDRTSMIDGIKMVSILEMPFRVQATMPTNPLAKALQAGVQSLVENNSDGYFSNAERWRCFEQVLQAIEEDLSGNLETISLWSSRETDREPERPRWTKNDEMTYRQVMNKLHILNQRNIRDLYDLRGEVQTFRNTIARKLEKMRSDLEYRGSENTSLFTYVTVVFLPLGFATSILSMSGPPDRSTLVSMITLSLVAMAITLFALASAKNTGKKIVQPLLESFHFINNLFLDPLVDLLLRLLRNISLILRKFFLFPKKVCLLLGMMFKFAILFGFYLFVSLPLNHFLDPKNHTGKKPSLAQSIQSTKKSVKNAFQTAFESIQRTSQSIEKKLAKEGSRDPFKLAEERFRKREEEKQREKKERDIESGGETLGQI